jgi:hypothetical protein
LIPVTIAKKLEEPRDWKNMRKAWKECWIDICYTSFRERVIKWKDLTKPKSRWWSREYKNSIMQAWRESGTHLTYNQFLWRVKKGLIKINIYWWL